MGRILLAMLRLRQIASALLLPLLSCLLVRLWFWGVHVVGDFDYASCRSGFDAITSNLMAGWLLLAMVLTAPTWEVATCICLAGAI